MKECVSSRLCVRPCDQITSGHLYIHTHWLLAVLLLLTVYIFLIWHGNLQLNVVLFHECMFNGKINQNSVFRQLLNVGRWDALRYWAVSHSQTCLTTVLCNVSSHANMERNHDMNCLDARLTRRHEWVRISYINFSISLHLRTLQIAWF